MSLKLDPARGTWFQTKEKASRCWQVHCARKKVADAISTTGNIKNITISAKYLSYFHPFSRLHYECRQILDFKDMGAVMPDIEVIFD